MVVEAIDVPKPPAPKRQRTQATTPTAEETLADGATEPAGAAGRHSG